MQGKSAYRRKKKQYHYILKNYSLSSIHVFMPANIKEHGDVQTIRKVKFYARIFMWHRLDFIIQQKRNLNILHTFCALMTKARGLKRGWYIGCSSSGWVVGGRGMAWGEYKIERELASFSARFSHASRKSIQLPSRDPFWLMLLTIFIAEWKVLKKKRIFTAELSKFTYYVQFLALSVANRNAYILELKIISTQAKITAYTWQCSSTQP